METISQRNIGGRHRQGDDEHDGIPAPRTGASGPARAPWDTARIEPARNGTGPTDAAPPDTALTDAADDGWDDDWSDDDARWDDARWDDGPDGTGTDDAGPAGTGRDGDRWDGDRRDDDREGDAPADERDVEPVDAPPFGTGAQGAVYGTGPQHAVSSTGPNRAVTATGPHRGVGAPPVRPRRRRAPRAGAGLRRALWVVAAVAALVGIGLAAVVVFPGLTRGTPAEVPVSVAAPIPAEAAFGERLVRADGWTIEIDEPRAVKAADDIDLPAGAERGIVVDVVLTNTGAEPRGTAGWTVKAIVGSAPVEVLPDGGAPSRTIRPGASLTFPVAVPMPEDTTDLQLEAAPPAGVPSLFVGTG
ncbi:MAG: hypothetical protein ACT4RN_23775 [Pseudonocardia sp.]